MTIGENIRRIRKERRLTLKQLYKNAMLFAVLKWFPNLGILLLDAILVFIPLFFINGNWSLYISLILYAAIDIFNRRAEYDDLVANRMTIKAPDTEIKPKGGRIIE